MAGYAAFGFHGFVFKGERAGLVGMALEADLVLRRRAAQLLGQKAAVLVMAITATHQTLIDAMPERTLEILPRLGVAAVAKLRLLLHE